MWEMRKAVWPRETPTTGVAHQVADGEESCQTGGTSTPHSGSIGSQVHGGGGVPLLRSGGIG